MLCSKCKETWDILLLNTLGGGGAEGWLPRYERQGARPIWTQHFDLAFKRLCLTRMLAELVQVCPSVPVRAARVEGG